MKKRIRIITILSCVFILSMAALVLSSCKLKALSKEEIIKNGYVHTVTIDFQGGTASGRTQRVIQVKDGSYIAKPGTTTNSDYAEPKRVDDTDKISYILEGYFNGTVDENGVLTYGKEWNFATDKVNADTTIYAKWRKNYSIRINYIDENAAEGEKQKTTSILVNQDENGLPQSINKSSLRVSLFTALGYYYDKDYQNEIEFEKQGNQETLQLTSEQLNREKTEFDIFMDGLNGTWQVVRETADFKSISTGTNVYLLCDIDMDDIYGKDVNWDCDWNGTQMGEMFGKPVEESTPEAKEVQAALKKLTFTDNYNGKFYGNGHVIKNIRANQVQDGRERYFGIFKQLGEKAEIKDVTFENVTVNVKITNTSVNDYYLGVLAGYTNEKSTIKNVTISGTVNCKIDEKDGLAERIQPSAFLGDNTEHCKPENCKYDGVTVIKNGVTVVEGTVSPDTAE